jgi:hypothetical protein
MYSPTSACPILNKNSSRPADLQVYRDIKSRDLTQVQAGEIQGIKQPHHLSSGSDLVGGASRVDIQAHSITRGVAWLDAHTCVGRLRKPA